MTRTTAPTPGPRRRRGVLAGLLLALCLAVPAGTAGAAPGEHIKQGVLTATADGAGKLTPSDGAILRAAEDDLYDRPPPPRP